MRLSLVFIYSDVLFDVFRLSKAVFYRRENSSYPTLLSVFSLTYISFLLLVDLDTCALLEFVFIRETRCFTLVLTSKRYINCHCFFVNYMEHLLAIITISLLVWVNFVTTYWSSSTTFVF